MQRIQMPLIPSKPGILHIPGMPGGTEAGRTSSSHAVPALKSLPAKGPWGRLEQFPFFLEAPEHLLERFPLPNSKPRWFVAATEVGQVLDRLTRAGLPQEILQAINQPANRAFLGDQIVFFPPPAALLKLSPGIRAALYRELRRFPANVDIVGPVVIANGDVDAWFSGSLLRPELIALIRQMSYPRGDALVFSDVSLLMGSVVGESEARAVISVLTRTRTLMLKLNFAESARPDEITGYWDSGPNRSHRQAARLLRSMIGTHSDEKLDVAHLLPAIPKRLLYTYPDLSTMADGEMPDCHWTSLNFFQSQPEAFYLDARLASSALNERCLPVKAPHRFGDLLVFIDNALGTVFHSCVYIADDVVFTKNGKNLLSPWVFQTLDHLKKTYLFDNNGRIQAYRMKEISGR